MCPICVWGCLCVGPILCFLCPVVVSYRFCLFVPCLPLSCLSIDYLFIVSLFYCFRLVCCSLFVVVFMKSQVMHSLGLSLSPFVSVCLSLCMYVCLSGFASPSHTSTFNVYRYIRVHTRICSDSNEVRGTHPLLCIVVTVNEQAQAQLPPDTTKL